MMSYMVVQGDEETQEILHGQAFMWYIECETRQFHSGIERAASQKEQQTPQRKKRKSAY